MNQAIADIRKDYKLKSLLEVDVLKDPIEQFSIWWNEAVSSQIDDVNAMSLATASADGQPSVRVVLLKGFNENGFMFFTNYQSDKGKALAENPRAALCFYWKELERQVRIEGAVQKVDEKTSTDYFISRPVESQIGAWSSPQSQPIAGRHVIEENVLKYKAQFAKDPITRPPHWGGYNVYPERIEFWQGRASRLHDRILYQRDNGGWKISRLAP